MGGVSCKVLIQIIWGADYQVAESFGLQLDYSDETSDFRDTTFPARYIYERVLPKVVAEHSNIHYHRGSPYSGHGKPTTDRTYGDIHQCESKVALWNILTEFRGRECLAWVTRAMAKLGYPGWAIRIRIRNVSDPLLTLN